MLPQTVQRVPALDSTVQGAEIFYSLHYTYWEESACSMCTLALVYKACKQHNIWRKSKETEANKKESIILLKEKKEDQSAHDY